MNKKDNKNDMLLSFTTLNLSSGLCYGFFVTSNYNAYRTSFNSLVPDEKRNTKVVELNDKEKTIVDQFIESTVKGVYEKDFDFDVVYDVLCNFGGQEWSFTNNSELESKCYSLIELLAANHPELDDSNLLSIEDLKKYSKPEGPVKSLNMK